jgi:hypothetical protein
MNDHVFLQAITVNIVNPLLEKGDGGNPIAMMADLVARDNAHIAHMLLYRRR